MTTLKTWGVLIWGTLITAGFLGTAFALYFTEIPASQREYALIILGAMIAELARVGSYWTGSTASSREKDATIAEIAKQ